MTIARISRHPCCLLLFLLACLAIALDAQAAENEDYSLSRGHGYVLLEYQSQSSLIKVELETRGIRTTRVEKPWILDDPNERFMLVPLREGQYHILSVSVPYFDLPFKRDVSEDSRWGFSVEAGKVNYIGALLIDSERSRSYVGMQLVNRWAASLDDIETRYRPLLDRYPVVLNMAYKDPFQVFLEDIREH